MAMGAASRHGGVWMLTACAAGYACSRWLARAREAKQGHVALVGAGPGESPCKPAGPH